MAPKSTDPVAELLQQLGIDLSDCPPVMTTVQLAPHVGMTPAALTQSRADKRQPTIPYTKIGNRVRYLRADVAMFLVANRRGGERAS